LTGFDVDFGCTDEGSWRSTGRVRPARCARLGTARAWWPAGSEPPRWWQWGAGGDRGPPMRGSGRRGRQPPQPPGGPAAEHEESAPGGGVGVDIGSFRIFSQCVNMAGVLASFPAGVLGDPGGPHCVLDGLLRGRLGQVVSPDDPAARIHRPSARGEQVLSGPGASRGRSGLQRAWGLLASMGSSPCDAMLSRDTWCSMRREDGSRAAPYARVSGASSSRRFPPSGKPSFRSTRRSFAFAATPRPSKSSRLFCRIPRAIEPSAGVFVPAPRSHIHSSDKAKGPEAGSTVVMA
jgi:hypothetical protein